MKKLAFFKYLFLKYLLELSDTKVVGFPGNPHQVPSDTCKWTPYPVRNGVIFQ